MNLGRIRDLGINGVSDFFYLKTKELPLFALYENSTTKLKYMENKCYAITGTYHGSIVYASSEGNARKAFHWYYNGESILHVKRLNGYL